MSRGQAVSTETLSIDEALTVTSVCERFTMYLKVKGIP